VKILQEEVKETQEESAKRVRQQQSQTKTLLNYKEQQLDHLAQKYDSKIADMRDRHEFQLKEIMSLNKLLSKVTLENSKLQKKSSKKVKKTKTKKKKSSDEVGFDVYGKLVEAHTKVHHVEKIVLEKVEERVANTRNLLSQNQQQIPAVFTFIETLEQKFLQETERCEENVAKIETDLSNFEWPEGVSEKQKEESEAKQENNCEDFDLMKEAYEAKVNATLDEMTQAQKEDKAEIEKLTEKLLASEAKVQEQRGLLENLVNFPNEFNIQFANNFLSYERQKNLKNKQ